MNTDCQFWWNWWVSFAMALATTLAVIIALFGDKFKAGMFPSKLRLSLRNTTGEKTKVTYETMVNNQPVRHEENARYYHIKVENQTRWPRSNQTQIILQRVEQPGPDGILQIKWDGEVPMEWQHQKLYPLTRTIGPDANCDLCSVGESGWLRLHPVLIPNSLQVVYRTSTILVLTFQAKGNEGNSPITRIRIAWDGIWHEGEAEMGQHLVIRDITAQA